jgi:hypothetical protein
VRARCVTVSTDRSKPAAAAGGGGRRRVELHLRQRVRQHRFQAAQDLLAPGVRVAPEQRQVGDQRRDHRPERVDLALQGGEFVAAACRGIGPVRDPCRA